MLYKNWDKKYWSKHISETEKQISTERGTCAVLQSMQSIQWNFAYAIHDITDDIDMYIYIYIYIYTVEYRYNAVYYGKILHR